MYEVSFHLSKSYTDVHKQKYFYSKTRKQESVSSSPISAMKKCLGAFESVTFLSPVDLIGSLLWGKSEEEGVRYCMFNALSNLQKK